MTKFQKEIIDAISMYEEIRQEALARGDWDSADDCLKDIKRLDISFRRAQREKYIK